MRGALLSVALFAMVASAPTAFAFPYSGGFKFELPEPRPLALAPGENDSVTMVANFTIEDPYCTFSPGTQQTFALQYAVVPDSASVSWLNVSLSRASDEYVQKCGTQLKSLALTIAVSADASPGGYNLTIVETACGDEQTCLAAGCSAGCSMAPEVKRTLSFNVTPGLFPHVRLARASLSSSGENDAVALPWYRAPFAPDNIPNTLQVGGALVAASTFLFGVVVVRRRRSVLRELLAEVDARARARAPRRPRCSSRSSAAGRRARPGASHGREAGRAPTRHHRPKDRHSPRGVRGAARGPAGLTAQHPSNTRNATRPLLMRAPLALLVVAATLLAGCSTQSPAAVTTSAPPTGPRDIVKPVSSTPPPPPPPASARATLVADDRQQAYVATLVLLAAGGSRDVPASGHLDEQVVDDVGKVLLSRSTLVGDVEFYTPPGAASTVVQYSWTDAWADLAHTTDSAPGANVTLLVDFTTTGGVRVHANATAPAVGAIRPTFSDQVRFTLITQGWECRSPAEGSYAPCGYGDSAAPSDVRYHVRVNLTNAGTTPLNLSGYALSLHTREGAEIVPSVGGETAPDALAPGDSTSWSESFGGADGQTPIELIYVRACCRVPQAIVPLPNVPRAPAPAPSAPTPAPKPTYLVNTTNMTVETNKGTFVIALLPNIAPKTVSHIESLVRAGFYTGIPFHRYVADFVIQGGDPDCRESLQPPCGSGGSGTTVPLEANYSVKHDYGAVGLARASDPNSGDSQFYVVNNANGDHNLDGEYTVFGRVISGMDVVMSLRVGDVMSRVYLG